MGEIHFAIRRAIADPAMKEARLARIEELEQELFERACGIVGAAMQFAEVDPAQEVPPQQWIDELGEEAAMQKLRVAKLGYCPQSHAPTAFTIATRFIAGTMKGRANRLKITQNNLNVKMTLPVPTTAEHPGPATYEVRELETT